MNRDITKPAGDAADAKLVAPARETDARIERGVALDRFGAPLANGEPWIWNSFGEQGMFRLTRKRK